MNDISFDPDAVIAFSNDIMDELEYTIRPWITRIRADMAGDGGTEMESLRTLGNGDEGAHHRGYGNWQALNIERCLNWLTELETGLEALSLSSAVIVEKLRAGDELSAEEMGLVTAMGGVGQQYVI